LFKTGIGESLLEADSLNEERISDRSSSNPLDTNILLVESIIQLHDCIDNHVTEEVLMLRDNL
jgi:hypothetical protein